MQPNGSDGEANSTRVTELEAELAKAKEERDRFEDEWKVICVSTFRTKQSSMRQAIDYLINLLA